MKKIFLLLLLVSVIMANAPYRSVTPADKWVDSVFNTLSKDQKIGQLMVMRVSGFNPAGVLIFHDNEVAEAIRKYDIGGICLFQGGPLKQAQLINYFQGISKTPLLVSIDAENGLGMRLDSVTPLPRQMMLGATQDPTLVYDYGRLVGEQCKRMGIQVDFAPVVDVNNNPANPVINDRSYGENKYRVAQLGIQYMKGLQDVGVMACAKHFPGHGDVSVDSHLDLPVVTKTKEQLDSLELYPFNQLIKNDIGSIMVAHLQVPAIDDKPNMPTSISYDNVTKLLRNELGFKGITFTDALEMKGVAKYFPNGESSVQALIAGNDMLCLPEDVATSIDMIKKAIRKNQLTWDDIDAHVKRILYAKYKYGLANRKPVNLFHLTEDLNSGINDMRKRIAENAITLLRNDDPSLYPLAKGKRIAYVGFGIGKDNIFARQLRNNYDAQVYYFDYSLDSAHANAALELFRNRYDVVIVGLHNYARFPANHFGISGAASMLLSNLQYHFKTITFIFGNPYIIKDVCDTKMLVECYEDDDITQQTASDMLGGRFLAKGTLPVSVCESFKYGDGIVTRKLIPTVDASDLGFNAPKMSFEIDSIVNDAIEKQAIPGAVVLVAKDGKIAFQRAYGYLDYEKKDPVYNETIYDLASVTKNMATLLSVMRLYDEGKLDLQKTLGDYLPWVKGTDKAPLKIWDILLHQAGLKAWIPFYRETVDTLHDNVPNPEIYHPVADAQFNVRVAEGLYMRHDWLDTMYRRIIQSELSPAGKYIYSDNDFIFMGKIVEAITGMPLEQYVKKTFYDALHLSTTGFKPRERFPLNDIAPTEYEKGFRNQEIHGDVHDPGAAMFGGVAGHAGLFSDAYDLAVLCQMLLDGGTFNDQSFIKKQTIDFFSEYHSNDSRRGLGFDKPEKDNATRKEPYPCFSASPQTYGHTGFTGTCYWVDPKYNLIFIFLSNRVNSPEANKFLRMNIRPKVHEAIYQAMFEGSPK